MVPNVLAFTQTCADVGESLEKVVEGSVAAGSPDLSRVGTGALLPPPCVYLFVALGMNIK